MKHIFSPWTFDIFDKANNKFHEIGCVTDSSETTALSNVLTQWILNIVTKFNQCSGLGGITIKCICKYTKNQMYTVFN